jgi:hypothetical protein
VAPRGDLQRALCLQVCGLRVHVLSGVDLQALAGGDGGADVAARCWDSWRD